MTPEQITKVQVQLENIASNNRRPLPDQDSLRQDLIDLGGQFELFVEQLSQGVNNKYSEADLWAVAVLIAQMKVEALTNGIST